MFRLSVMAIGFATMLLAAVACGGGSEKTIDLGDGNKVTIGDDLPDSFPDDFPIYDGADLQNAVEGEQEGIRGVVATWTTGDDFDDVKSFYARELSDGPWKSTGDGTSSGSAFWTIENDSGGQVGYVTLVDGDVVAITAIVGDDSSAAADEGADDGSDSGDDSGSDSSADPGTTDLPDEVALSDDFPRDKVSLPDDARVTGSSSVNAGGAQTHFIAFYSKDSIDDLAAFFKDDLEGKGYGQSFQSSDGTGVYASYAENDDGTGVIVIVTISEGDVEGYRQVGLQVTDS